MEIGELKKLGMSIVREIEIPKHWIDNLSNISDKEIFEWFKNQIDLEIELRPLILPKEIYDNLLSRTSSKYSGTLLDEIQKYYGKISYLSNEIIIK